MGVYVSRPTIEFDGEKIAQSIIHGLGGPQTMEAIRTGMEQLTANADQMATHVDHFLFALTTDVHHVAISITVLVVILAVYVLVLMFQALRRASSSTLNITLLVGDGQSSWTLVLPQREGSGLKDGKAQLVIVQIGTGTGTQSTAQPHPAPLPENYQQKLEAMPPKKRTILVAFEGDDGGGDQKRQRKLAVSIAATATNSELAQEISASLNESSVTLEILGGFKLRGQDGVDTIPEGEHVTARSSVLSGAISKFESFSGPDSPADVSKIKTSQDDPGRFQFRFVTAEMARLHARHTPKDLGEPSNGKAAFGGEFVSGNTTLREVQQEAARVLGWTSAESMDLDDVVCDMEHEDGQACSCPIAQEIEQYGVSGTQHCRFTTNGTSCGKSKCPYSHVKLIASPCPKCLPTDASASLLCPLVQNAGCGHLHHAHCIGARRSKAPVNCPSGCPIATFPREAVVFDRTDAHLILAYDGNKIDRISIPFSLEGVCRSESGITIVRSDTVVSIVEKYLQEKEFAYHGLSLFIHFRDAFTETVQFSQTTLVSVCHATSHLHQGARRFPLFSGKIETPVRLRQDPFAIDLHTSQAPIIACGCTLIKDLFSSTAQAVEGPRSLVLYAVKRRLPEISDREAARQKLASKQSMYLADPAWHPSIPQTARGMAALLSSLYLLAHSVAQKQEAGEQKVLALAYIILRFPPAVRTLAGLFLNKVPRPEDKAALGEALYHALKEFSASGPSVIVRILLAYLAGAANESSSASPRRPVEEVSLVCTISQTRLQDPVLLGSAVVERAVANLRQPGGQLFRPSSSENMSSTSTVSEMGSNHDDQGSLMELLASARGLRSDSRTLLVPLELKSVDVVAPQIVLDQEGLLAVFTGRGCGTARDVNFFRPTNGGDTEVDVNDVSHSLEKIIIERRLEDTWHVDSFGAIEAGSKARPPDENLTWFTYPSVKAIVLCLDLSESMSQKSGVSKSPRHSDESAEFNVPLETEKLVEKLTEDLTRDQIIYHAEAHLQAQHASCHKPWWKMLHPTSDDNNEDEDEDPVASLLRELATIASREALHISFQQEGEQDQDDTDDDEDMYSDSSEPQSRAKKSDDLLRMACFIAAVEDGDMNEELVESLNDMLVDAHFAPIGEAPYDVPPELVDFKTGELLVDPVRPKKAPPKTFVNSTSRPWFEAQHVWPAGHSVPQYESVPKLKKAVKTWIAGTDLLPNIAGTGRAISITLRHLDKVHTWCLLPETPVKTLYSLANRAMHGAYSSFALRPCNSHIWVRPTDGLLSQTNLARGGDIELLNHVKHKRQSYEVTVDGLMPNKILMPQDSTILALLSYLQSSKYAISDLMLWHGLADTGDGRRRGQLAEPNTSLSRYASDTHAITFDWEPWRWFPTGAQETREESRHLSRLDLLKELFTVFLNRAGSFDTAVSLVLGLVTFSDIAVVGQELTPVFEQFREKLDIVTPYGDTAVYDALDSARRLLINYRSDLPNLRRRIVIVSDGEDTSSETYPWVVCGALQKADIIVDSVQVGKKSGYRFSPRTSLADAMSIFDLETMLSSGDRPVRERKPLVSTQKQLQAYGNYREYPIEIVTVDQFPPRAKHKKLKQPVKSAATSFVTRGGGDDRMKRIMREVISSRGTRAAQRIDVLQVKALVTDPHPNIDVYVNDSDMSFLKIILEAPKDVENCPYKGGTFLLTCDLPVGYPRDPPEVSKQGKVCIAELGRLWSSDITLKEILSLVYGTLLTPDLENPLEIQASLKYCAYILLYCMTTTEHTLLRSLMRLRSMHPKLARNGKKNSMNNLA
ncbi:hypothetical protein B0H11DRAFT_1919124 [Mycena galericulata]|nr:hypothetical protein B0H11DRAFT_1919124 [Mycena galericulata]